MWSLIHRGREFSVNAIVHDTNTNTNTTANTNTVVCEREQFLLWRTKFSVNVHDTNTTTNKNTTKTKTKNTTTNANTPVRKTFLPRKELLTDQQKKGILCQCAFHRYFHWTWPHFMIGVTRMWKFMEILAILNLLYKWLDAFVFALVFALVLW